MCLHPWHGVSIWKRKEFLPCSWKLRQAAKVAHWTAVPPLNQCPLTVLCHWSCSKSLTHLHARLDTAFLRAALIFLCKCMPRSSRVFVHISLHIHEMPVSSMPSMKKLVTRVTGTVRRGPATGYIAKVLIWDHQWYPVIFSGTRGTLEGQRLLSRGQGIAPPRGCGVHSRPPSRCHTFCNTIAILELPS